MLLEKLGIIEGENSKKLTFKPTALNKKLTNGINHHISQHTMNLQRSQYLCIDDNIEKNFVLDTENKKYIKFKQFTEEEEIRNIFKEIKDDV